MYSPDGASSVINVCTMLTSTQRFCSTALLLRRVKIGGGGGGGGDCKEDHTGSAGSDKLVDKKGIKRQKWPRLVTVTTTVTRPYSIIIIMSYLNKR